MRRFLLVAAGLIVALPVAAAASDSAQLREPWAMPSTLVSTPTSVWSFAQDDRMLAWETGDEWSTRSRIDVRAAVGGTPVTISRLDGGDGGYVMEVFGLGGQRVVWGGFVDCCNSGYGLVETAAPGSKPRTLRPLDLEEWAWGEYPTGAAGDGQTLAYSTAAIWPLDQAGKDWRVTGGGVWRVTGTKGVRVPSTPPTALLAAAAKRVALVPADRRRYQGPCSEKNPLGCPEVRVAPGARVEIRDVVTGTLRAAFAPKGRISAVGMDRKTTVVIARSGGEARVEWYSARSGRLLRSSSVPRDVADLVDIAGRTIVLRRGKTILAVDTRTARLRELARASSTPIGLSIEGSRVAWAERTKSGGVIRAVLVD